MQPIQMPLRQPATLAHWVPSAVRRRVIRRRIAEFNRIIRLGWAEDNLAPNMNAGPKADQRQNSRHVHPARKRQRMNTLLFVLSSTFVIAPLCAAFPVRADDISNWSEIDDNNNRSPPNGWPAGMLPTEVEPTARAMMGAIKRFYDTNTSPSVANTTALRASSTAVFPNGVTRLTDGVAGAPPLHFTVGSGACSTDDGASCVNSSDGNHWNGVFPVNGADIRQWGAIADDTTDSGPPLQKALAWAATGTGRRLSAPPGTFYVGTAPGSITLGSTASISLVGIGSDATIFDAASGVTPFLLSKPGTASSYHFRDFTCATRGAAAAGASCIKVMQTEAASPSNDFAASDLTNITCRGNDGYKHTDVWDNCFYTNFDSYITFNNVQSVGASVGDPTDGSIGFNLSGGTGTQIGIVYTFNGGGCTQLNTCVLYGPSIQGVTIDANFNMIGNFYGVHVPPSEGLTAQLTLTDSQCGFNMYCVRDETGVGNLIISQNLIYSSNPNNIGVMLDECFFCTVSNNQFFGSNTSGVPAGSVGLSIIIGQGIAQGNSFSYLATGQNFGFGANIQMSGVSYAHNTTNITSTAPLSTLHAGMPAVWQAVTGCSNDAGLAEVTVSSTAGWYDGELAQIQGVGGVLAVSGVVYSPVHVVDATHLELLAITFSGAYTSGGFITAVP